MPIRPINRTRNADGLPPTSTPLPSTPLPSTSNAKSAPTIQARIRTRPEPIPSSTSTDARTGRDAAPSTKPRRPHHKVDRSGPNYDEEGNYVVGKNRPPREHQWKPGQSGNAAGPKRKEVLDPVSEFERQVVANFTGKVNGEDVSMNLGTFSISLLKAAAAKGRTRAQEKLLELYLTILHKQAAQAATPEAEAWEQDVVDALLAELDLPAMPVRRKARDETDNGPDEELVSRKALVR